MMGVPLWVIWLSVACFVLAFIGDLLGEYANASGCAPGARAMWLRIIGGACMLAGFGTLIYPVFVKDQYWVVQLYLGGAWGGMAIGQFATGSAGRDTATGWLLVSLAFAGAAVAELIHVFAVMYTSGALFIGGLLMLFVSWLRRQRYKTQSQ